MRTDVSALILIAFGHGASRRFCKLMGLASFTATPAYVMVMNHEDPAVTRTA
ncbi:hypothetical protein TGAMA5MH_07603 [Trichoderma gamsii]|uniref:Uncharacterized protein n=1 Tax=Trichoderma gamsii TaxID=398673 RepID=A0A2K0T523_9HYPO|nr:hypothetical protein TGAMA5MH_07603 [Trichoderma gamsii]